MALQYGTTEETDEVESVGNRGLPFDDWISYSCRLDTGVTRVPQAMGSVH